MNTKSKLMQHFRSLREALVKAGAGAYLDPVSFIVKVRFGEEIVTLHPHFIIFVEGSKQYTHEFSPEVQSFIGWRPYHCTSVDLFTDKLGLKQVISSRGILTPQYSTSAACTFEDVVVKQRVSSFGVSLRGPFRRAADTALDLDKGEYFERFISGYIVKIWYWNGEFVCFERQEMPAIKGNGRRTIGRILDKTIKKLPEDSVERVDREEITQVLEFYGRSMDHILERNETQIIDIKYGSRFAGPIEEISQAHLTTLQLKQLKEMGSILWELVKKEVKKYLVFTVDAILDKDGSFWLLEANANPIVHPWVYEPMMCTLAAAKRVRREKETVD